MYKYILLRIYFNIILCETKKNKIKFLTDTGCFCLLSHLTELLPRHHARGTSSPSLGVCSHEGPAGEQGSTGAARPGASRAFLSAAHPKQSCGREGSRSLPTLYQGFLVFCGAGGCVGRETQTEDQRQSDPQESLTPTAPAFAAMLPPSPTSACARWCPAVGVSQPQLSESSPPLFAPQEEAPGSLATQ